MSGKPFDIWWTEEKYKYDEQSFERFSIPFFKENDHHVKAKVLHSFIQSYLQQFTCIQEGNLNAFLDLVSEVSNMCSKFLSTLKSVEQPSETEMLLRNLSNNLESADLCFDIILACLKICDEKHLIFMIKTALNILSQSYTHCKASETIYGEQLEKFVNQLGNIFKKIENLQIVILQHLDHLTDAKNFEDNSDINSIVYALGNLCQVVSSLDADVSFELWTIYLRIINNHQRCLDESSDSNLVLKYLVSKNTEILNMSKFNLEKNSVEDEELCVMLKFYLDTLLKMLKIINVKHCERIIEFRTLLLTLFDFLISCYSSSLVRDKIVLITIKETLSKTVVPLLSHLYADEKFLISVLLLAPQEVKPFQTALSLLKVCGLQFLKSATMQDQVLKEVFMCLLSNTPEDDMNLLYCKIPLNTVSKTDSDELIVLYQFASEKISEFSTLLPDPVIQDLQNTILDCIVSCSDTVFLLISDVWIYRLRCRDIEFLKIHCCSILQNYLMKDVESYVKLKILLKRMLKFLPQSEKEVLSKKFNLLKVITEEEIVLHVQCVADFATLENDLFTNLDEKISLLMSKLNEPLGNSAHHLIQQSCTCLELCTLFLNFSGCIETLQFIQLASQLFRSEVYEVQIATLTFLKALSRKCLPEHNPDFGKVVTSLAELFSETVHSKNYIVKYEALNTFSYFAKCTPHVKIVQETVKRYPSLKTAMKSYVTAVPSTGFLSEKERSESLRSQISNFNPIKFEISEHSQELLRHVLSKITCHKM